MLGEFNKSVCALLYNIKIGYLFLYIYISLESDWSLNITIKIIYMELEKPLLLSCKIYRF